MEVTELASTVVIVPQILLLVNATTTNTIAISEGLNLPRLIFDAGDQAELKFINFFTIKIKNDNTRDTHLCAVRQFDVWCSEHKTGLSQPGPFVVAAYTKQLKDTKQAKIAHPLVMCNYHERIEIFTMKYIIDYIYGDKSFR